MELLPFSSTARFPKHRRPATIRLAETAARRFLTLIAFLVAGAATTLGPVARAQDTPEAIEPASGAASGARPAAPPVAQDLREDTAWIEVNVADLYGRRESRRIPVTMFRPAGEGPFPLIVMNHGRSPADRRATQTRQRYEALSRYFVSKGFVVLLPTRVGYADTYGDFDPESTGGCSRLRLEPQAEAAVTQVLATVAWARTLPFVDTEHWIVAGQSVGGLTAVATAWHHPPGLVGALNFAGGTGGDPDRSPGRPCRPDEIASYWGGQASAAAGVPMLWLYWENDEYWGADVPKRWRAAWAAGGGKLEFHQLRAVGPKGHGGVGFDMDHWVPLVETWLGGLGYTTPGVVPRPPPTGYARLQETDVPPLQSRRIAEGYRAFLEQKPPRAFAIGPDGSFGHASGDWALGRALGNCLRRAVTGCRLYAVDDEVVWPP